MLISKFSEMLTTPKFFFQSVDALKVRIKFFHGCNFFLQETYFLIQHWVGSAVKDRVLRTGAPW